MQRLVSIIVIVVVVIALAFIYTGTYTVSQWQTAIKFHLGEIVATDIPPGLHLKWPIVDTVKTFDARIHTLDLEPQRFMTVGKKNVIVDAFLKWRIADVSEYYVTVGGSPQVANMRLAAILRTGLRNEFGERTINEVVTTDRIEIMKILERKTDKAAESLGLEVVDVRIKRVDYPKTVTEAVYRRMRSERERAAARLRAEGKEAAARIRAEANRRRRVILANARRAAKKIRGAGDARAAEIYAQAYGQYPDFYSFYRSLKAYRKAFSRKDDLLVLPADSKFFKYLNLDGEKP